MTCECAAVQYLQHSLLRYMLQPSKIYTAVRNAVLGGNFNESRGRQFAIGQPIPRGAQQCVELWYASGWLV